MNDPPAGLTLIGRSSGWGMRVVAPRPSRCGDCPSPATASGRVMRTWLHHPSYGTLGVYLREAAGGWPPVPPARQWIQVQGHIRLCWVHAQPDDPRSATAPWVAPLALALTGPVIVVGHRVAAAGAGLALLPCPQPVRLQAGHRSGPGYLAPVAQQPDLYYWQVRGSRPPLIAHWNRIMGVIGTLGTTRYLRYVVRMWPEPR